LKIFTLLDGRSDCDPGFLDVSQCSSPSHRTSPQNPCVILVAASNLQHARHTPAETDPCKRPIKI
jgi:hypothetical protein